MNYTVREWLDGLPEPIRSAAWSCILKFMERRDDYVASLWLDARRVTCLSSALRGSLNFGTTPQGRPFWDSICSITDAVNSPQGLVDIAFPTLPRTGTPDPAVQGLTPNTRVYLNL